MARLLTIAFALGCITSATGCGFIEDAFSRSVDASGNPIPGTSTVEQVTGFVGGMGVPYAAFAGTALTTLWALIRGKRWKEAAVVTARTVEDFLKTEEGQAVAEKLKEQLQWDHKTAGVAELMQKVVDKFGHAG